MKKKLKRYIATLESINDGIFKVDIVDRPAIDQAAFYFSKQEQQEKFKFSVDDERKIILGPVLIPDEPIYRKQKINGIEEEFEIVFPLELMEPIMCKYMLKARKDNVGVMHTSDKPIDNAYIMSVFMSDDQLGVLPPRDFKDAKDKTIFFMGKVENDEVRAKFKSGEYTGWSIEGLFSFIDEELARERGFDLATELSKLLLT